MDDVGAPDTDHQVEHVEDLAGVEVPAEELSGYDVPEPPQTGDQAVDDAVLQLAAAVSQPLETQVAAFDATHRALQDRLADVES